MMKALDIALKDIRQSMRSRNALIFMFAIPILITVMFSLMFGSIAGGDDEGFTVPRTAVMFVNQDEGEMPIDSGGLEAANMGGLLGQMLQQDDLSDLMTITLMDDAVAARTAVDDQQAGAAIIIPAGFTAALTSDAENVALELYTDPTLTIGPAIVESIVGQFVDSFSAGAIGVGVTVGQLAEAGLPVTDELVTGAVVHYQQTGGQFGRGPLVNVQAPPGADNGQTNELASILGLILAGMMVFYAFFTGANTLNSILTEEENGTLQRLFTTPTSQLSLFSGKFLAALLVLSVQVAVLLLFGNLVFGINWGEPLPVALAAAGLVLIAATFGLFIVSLIKDSRQGGVIFGGLLTLTGMLGLMSVFTAGSPNTPPALDTIGLLVPQGWAIRGMRQAMEGQGLNDSLLTLGVVVALSAVFFFAGQWRLRKRFQ